MNAAGATAANPSLLPGVARPSPWLASGVLMLSFIAGLELIAATAATRAAVAWSPRLAGSATVAVRGAGLESTEAATARATEILARSPGVARVAVLDPDAGDGVAGKLMGLAASGGDTDPPRLIAATVDGGDEGSAANIAQALRRENVVAAVDDHDLWSGPLERGAAIAGAGAAGLLLLLLVVTWALAAASVAAAVGKRWPRISLLLHLGATDAAIIQPFRARAVGATAVGAVIGLGAAAALAGTIISSPAVARWISDRTAASIGTVSGLDMWDLASVVIWLPLAVLVALWAAGGAVRSRLRTLA
jgi:cell division protein FtsX